MNDSALQQLQPSCARRVRRRESHARPSSKSARPEMKSRGPGSTPVLDRLLDPPIRAAGIAHGGETAIEHLPQQHGSLRRQQGQRHRLQPIAARARRDRRARDNRSAPASTSCRRNRRRRAFAALIGLSDTSRIVPPSTNTSYPRRASSQRGSSRAALRNKTAVSVMAKARNSAAIQSDHPRPSHPRQGATMLHRLTNRGTAAGNAWLKASRT